MENLSFFQVSLYVLILCQMVAWLWFSWKGGDLTDKQFYLFTGGMLLGQLAAGIETFIMTAWGTFVVQVFFFVSTTFAGIQRRRKAKTKTR